MLPPAFVLERSVLRAASGLSLSKPIFMSKLAHAYLRRSYTLLVSLEAQAGLKSCLNYNRRKPRRRNGHLAYASRSVMRNT